MLERASSKPCRPHATNGPSGLRVPDSGPGIAEQHRGSIFGPFNRIVPLDQGGGLGLNLAKDIVDRHHGKITVGDAPGGGALFEIRLPVGSYQPR
jgi:signal transduction histidine kinase